MPLLGQGAGARVSRADAAPGVQDARAADPSRALRSACKSRGRDLPRDRCPAKARPRGAEPQGALRVVLNGTAGACWFAAAVAGRPSGGPGCVCGVEEAWARGSCPTDRRASRPSAPTPCQSDRLPGTGSPPPAAPLRYDRPGCRRQGSAGARLRRRRCPQQACAGTASAGHRRSLGATVAATSAPRILVQRS